MVQITKMDSSILRNLFNDVLNAIATKGYDILVTRQMSSCIKKGCVLINTFYLCPPGGLASIFIPPL